MRVCYNKKMQTVAIDKLAFIQIKDRRVLETLSYGKNVWYIPGGKREAGESDEQALAREIKEESGLDVKLYNSDRQIEMGDVVQLFRPMHVLLENINPFHQHIDFIYYATADTDILNPQNGETTDLKWFTAKEIKSLKGAPENVKVLAVEAINLLSTPH